MRTEPRGAAPRSPAESRSSAAPRSAPGSIRIDADAAAQASIVEQLRASSAVRQRRGRARLGGAQGARRRLGIAGRSRAAARVAEAGVRSPRRPERGARPAMTSTCGRTRRVRREPSARSGAHRHVRALRLLPAVVPDLRAVGRRNGLASRPHLPDEGGARRPHRDDAVLRRTLRRLSRLHGLRHVVPVGRAVRSAHRGDARSDRTAARAVARRPPVSRRDLRAVSVPGAAAHRARAAGRAAERRAALSRGTAEAAPWPNAERRRRTPTSNVERRTTNAERRTTNDDALETARDARARADGHVAIARRRPSRSGRRRLARGA